MKKLIFTFLLICTIAFSSSAWRIISYNCGTGRCHHLDKGVCKTFTPKDPSVTCEDVIFITADDGTDAALLRTVTFYYPDANANNTTLLRSVPKNLNLIGIATYETPILIFDPILGNTKLSNNNLDGEIIKITIFSFNLQQSWTFNQDQLNTSFFKNGNYIYDISVNGESIKRGILQISNL